MGKGEDDVYKYFLHFQLCFQKPSSSRFLKSVHQEFFHRLNTLLNDKSLDQSKLKAFADDKFYVAGKFEICFANVRKPCGKWRKC